MARSTPILARALALMAARSEHLEDTTQQEILVESAERLKAISNRIKSLDLLLCDKGDWGTATEHDVCFMTRDGKTCHDRFPATPSSWCLACLVRE